MKQLRKFVMRAVLSGLLLVIPFYLAVLLLLRAMGSLVRLVQPIVLMLPRWSHAEDVLALLNPLDSSGLAGTWDRPVAVRQADVVRSLSAHGRSAARSCASAW